MGKKCAVTNCRSGYKPTKEEEKKIKTGEISLAKRHIRLSNEASVRAQWVNAIGRRGEWDPDCSGLFPLCVR